MTLAEIERAAGLLTAAEQTELLYFLAQRLDQTDLPLPASREDFAKYLSAVPDVPPAENDRIG